MIRRSGTWELLTLSCDEGQRPSGEEVSREPKSRDSSGGKGFPRGGHGLENHGVWLVGGWVGGWAMVGDWASREQ